MRVDIAFSRELGQGGVFLPVQLSIVFVLDDDLRHCPQHTS